MASFRAEHHQNQARADGNGTRDRMKDNRVRPLHINLERPDVHGALRGEIRDALNPQSNDAERNKQHADDYEWSHRDLLCFRVKRPRQGPSCPSFGRN